MAAKKHTPPPSLQPSGTQFRAFIEKAHEGIVLYDEKGFIVYASPSIKNFIGYNEQDLLGKLGTDFIAEQDHEQCLEKFKEIRSRPSESLTFRQRLINIDGTSIWCETTLTNLLNESEVEGIISNFRDISKQKEAEDKLLESKLLLETINQNINEAIYRNVPGKKFAYVNQAFLKLFGFSSLESLNKISPSDLYADKKVRQKIHELLIQENKIDNIEVRFKKKNGKMFWGLISSTLVRDHLGREYFDGAIRDITYEKEAREKLKESEHLLSSINLNIKEGLYRSSFKNGLIYVNRAFVEMFGYKNKEDVINASIYDLYNDSEQRESIIGHLRRIGSIRNEEVLFKKRDGSNFWGLMSSYVTKEKNEEYFDGAIRDISDLKQVENQLIKLNKELRKQNQALALREEDLNIAMKELSDRNFELDQLVYKTSHDIRSPLTSILGLVNIAKKDDDKEARFQYLNKIEQSILKLDEFVKSMLNYAKASRVDVKLEKLEFRELINGCIRDLEYLDNYGTLETNIQIKGNNSYFRSDPLRLKIIFSNIISNAYKYCDDRKEKCFLNISVSINKKGLKISFKDNGIGIHEAHLSKIFDMFYRATEKSEGSGLGMYIVKQSIDKLEGTIKINSKEQVGTEIEIFLPASVR
ncbi:MAG: PAS domain S-box protein [Fulvivirga sp.]